MDGTLLNSKGEMPPDFPETFAAIKAQNIIFSAASGRQYFGLLDSFKEYQDDVLFLAENGSFVVHRGKEIYSNPIPKDDVTRIIAFARRIIKEANGNIDIMVNGKKAAYYHTHDQFFIDNVLLYCSRIQYVDNFDDIDDDILKIAFFVKDSTATKVFAKFQPLKGIYKTVLSSDCWIDVMKPNANKGDGLKHIMEKFNLKADEVAAFGDYMNDYEMMQTAYHSYAMKNAFPDLKKAARYETEKTNDECGVTYTIKKILAENK
jgi:hypothetical protein